MGDLSNALSDAPDGLSGEELLAVLRRRWAQLRPGQLARLLAEAGPLVVCCGRRYYLAASLAKPDGAADLARSDRPLRAVAVDLEALVRPVARKPYVERSIWQIGAYRFGPDASWVDAERRLVRWLQLPEGFDFADEATAAVHVARAEPASDVLAELLGFCAGADVVVAYNGSGMDFPVLDAAFDAVGLSRPATPRLVDGLYLAYCWWPTEVGHRLKELAERVGVNVGGLRWHDAGDDAELLARLLEHGASQVSAAWPDDFATLVAAANRRSDAWRLAFALAGRSPANGPLDDDDVAEVVEATLSWRVPRRGRPAAETLAVPDSWRGPSGRVEPYLLSKSLRGDDAQPRPSQDRMADEIQAAIANGVDLAVEAPTGTGKSLAALAAGIEWLASDREHRVVVATHTKQLQRQLANDVDALSAAAPTLLAHTSLVKGASNRLSLRALVGLFADLTVAGRRSGVLAEAAFAELLTYLLCRLVTPARGLLADAEAESVDLADVPAFFEEYSGRRWASYLAVTSQAAAGDYETAGGLGDHTNTVAEALAGSRLVIANHALVFSHLDDFGSFGDKTLLIVDEAHSVEGAATEALGWVLSYPALELVTRQLAAWASRADSTDALRGTAARLEDLLHRERIARAAMDAVDALAGPIVEERPRSAALISPFTGDAGRVPVRRLLVELGAVARTADGARRALLGWFAENRASLSRRDRNRFFDLRARLAAVADGVAGVVGDADLLGGTSYLNQAAPTEPANASNGAPHSSGVRSAASAATATSANLTTAGDDAGLDELDDDFGGDGLPSGDPGDVPDADADPGAAGTQGADGDEPSPPPSGDGIEPARKAANRVVWLAEQSGSQLAAGARGYRFEVRSSPIRVATDPGFARFRSTFARTVFTSATLTVAGNWGFLNDRLGLSGVRTLCLDGPFDYARQARLICFSDFPSWSEHAQAAMRTVAWQLVGYAVEAQAGGRAPGALVLTTSTAAASGIAEHLAAYGASAGLQVPLAAAPVLGNDRAVRQVQADGGWLVGTKGLWAGVNIEQPDRVRICWVNKLPFAPFADPIVAARRAEVAGRAEDSGHPDPDAVASEEYYLPLAALELRQAAGRLIRSPQHRGIIVISDRKLAGAASRRRTYRRILLGSLDPGLLVAGPDGDVAAGNVETMAAGWARMWEFLAADGDIDAGRLTHLLAPEALDEQTLLPETRQIRDLQLSVAELAVHRAAGTVEAEVVDRSARIGGLLRFSPEPIELKPEQAAAIAAVARGDDLMALLPTGFGKSFCFQLPALAMPGVTIVVSPLVALMADQAMELNRAIGGAVRALVAPMAESSSRAGRQEVAEQLTGAADHGIRLVYVSPERFAHRQFRAWVDVAAVDGRLARIVFDEAHCVAGWADFRPSYSRLCQLLPGLRAKAVPVSALTATANRTVRETLRSRLFALPSAPDPDRPDRETFKLVEADPIRPELALYRFALASGGQVSLARRLEAAYDAAAQPSAGGHAIFYCLTVREVNATWAHLRDYAGPAAGVRVRRFHGRLSEPEKASVLTDLREAPHAGDADFQPMIVVATSAFGLGINRDDIVTVFITSPPTDLAALYQQLGRAGRDQAGRIPADGERASVGVALATARGFRTVEFLTRDLPYEVLEASGREVLSCGGVLDATGVSEVIIDARRHAGALSIRDAVNDAVRSAHRTAVVRALAALSDGGVAEDLGDFPATVALGAGEAVADPADDPLGAAVTAWVAAHANIANKVSVLDVHAYLAAAGLVDPDDPAATWTILVDCHHGGILDVSQAPNRRWLTAVRVSGGELPAGFRASVTARATGAAAELAALRAWYADTGRCANQGMADYFAHGAVGRVPAGTCSTPPCRCSFHWAAATSGARPKMLDALLFPPARPASATEDQARTERLDIDVARLFADNAYGLGARAVYYCLRGQARVPDGAGGLKPLPSGLYYHRLFGSRPAVRWAAVEASLTRLQAAGVAVPVERRWRSTAVIAAEAARAERAAAASGPTPKGPASAATAR